MRSLFVSVAAAAIALTTFSSTPASAAQRGGQEKFAVCHFAGNMRDDTEDRTGRVLLLPARAAFSHVTRHGDGPLFLIPLLPGFEDVEFERGEECTIRSTSAGGTGEVIVDGETVLPELGRAQLRGLLLQAVEASDLSQSEKDALRRLIVQAFG